MKNSIKLLACIGALMSALAASAGPIVPGNISGDGLTVSGTINSSPFSYTLTISSPPEAIFGSGNVISGKQLAGNYVVRGSTTAFDGNASTYGLYLNNGVGFIYGTEATANNYLNFMAGSGGFDAIAQFDFSTSTPRIAAFVYDPTGANINISSGIGNVVANATVPEPSIVMAIGGLGMLLLQRRRSTRTAGV